MPNLEIVQVTQDRKLLPGEDYSIQMKVKNEGNKIILFTARGTTTGVDWEDLTRKQLETWNVSYDDLLFGKPEADVYIDDKANDIFGWFLKN